VKAEHNVNPDKIKPMTNFNILFDEKTIFILQNRQTRIKALIERFPYITKLLGYSNKKREEAPNLAKFKSEIYHFLKDPDFDGVAKNTSNEMKRKLNLKRKNSIYEPKKVKKIYNEIARKGEKEFNPKPLDGSKESPTLTSINPNDNNDRLNEKLIIEEPKMLFEKNENQIKNSEDKVEEFKYTDDLMKELTLKVNLNVNEQNTVEKFQNPINEPKKVSQNQIYWRLMKISIKTSRMLRPSKIFQMI